MKAMHKRLVAAVVTEALIVLATALVVFAVPTSSYAGDWTPGRIILLVAGASLWLAVSAAAFPFEDDRAPGA